MNRDINRSRVWSEARLPLLAALLVAAGCGSPPTGESGNTDRLEGLEPIAAASVQMGQGPRRQALPVTASPEEVKQAITRSPALQSFLAHEGQGWEVSVDRRSGEAMLLQGPGISWTGSVRPYRVEKVPGLVGTVEGKARSLLRTHSGLLGVNDADLKLDEKWSGVPDASDDLMLVTLRHQPDGKSQRDARVTFVVRSGKLFQIHAERLTAIPATTPRLSQAQALERVKVTAQLTQEPTVLSNELQWVQLAATREAPGVYTGPMGKGYASYLAYVVRFKLHEDFKTYVAYIDALTGAQLELFDGNLYGTVNGGIYTRGSADGTEVVVPFANTSVSNSGTKTTDLGGNYSYSSGTASTSLGGTYFNVSDSCGNPNASTSTAPGNLALGTSSGTDCSLSPSGHSTRAARNAFYHLNNARLMGMKWLSGVNSKATAWFATNVTAVVNYNDYCNAGWDGSEVVFFRSGGGCANTGEIADVMQHEWGHGLDENTKSGSTGDTAKGEAVSDGVALLMTHDQCIGPGFTPSGGGETATCPTAVRDLAFVVTAGNIDDVCPTDWRCTGALGYECHCESHILSGAYYQLSLLFVQRYGQNDGWNRFERLYLRAFANTTAYLPGTAGNAYDAMMAADDDNGNITDGTPNADIIYQAFNGQGLAGTQRSVNTTACNPAPATPTVTATAGNGSVALSWTAVSGADSYQIFRNTTSGGSAGLLPLTNGLTGTTYTDTQVANSYTYNYQVIAVDGSCISNYGTTASATPTAGGGDTTPPTTSLTFPASGATVNGTITLTADAGDNVGVNRVEFYVDGTLIGTDTTAPYSQPWGTTTVADGSHALTSKAYDDAGNNATSPAVTVTVNNGGGGCTQTTQLLANPGFESGAVSWTASTGVIDNSSSPPARTGSYKAWLDGYGQSHTDYLYQGVTVPANACSATLKFWLRVTTKETSGSTAYDTLTVTVRNTSNTVLQTLATYSNLDKSSSYLEKTFNLTAYKGQTIRIHFNGVEDASLATSFLIDDTSLNVTQ